MKTIFSTFKSSSILTITLSYIKRKGLECFSMRKSYKFSWYNDILEIVFGTNLSYNTNSMTEN